MAAKSSVAEHPSDTVLVIERVFDAPPELVFKAWTERDRISQWMCPKNFTVLFADGDLRPGGTWRSGMRSPEGRDYIARGVYREIERPQRLVFTHGWEQNDIEPVADTLVTVSFAAEGGKTKMVFEQTGLASAKSRDSHRGGWSESFDNLTRLLATQAK